MNRWQDIALAALVSAMVTFVIVAGAATDMQKENRARIVKAIEAGSPPIAAVNAVLGREYGK